MAIPNGKTAMQVMKKLEDKFIQEMKEEAMKKILLAKVPKPKWFDGYSTNYRNSDDVIDAIMFNQLYMGNWDPAKECTGESVVTEVKFEDGKLNIEVIPAEEIYKDAKK